LPPDTITATSPLSQQAQAWSDQGLRVLLFAYNPEVTRLHNQDMIWWVPPLGYYFGILVKPFSITSSILGVVVIWFFLIRAIWRANLFERFLGLNNSPFD
jgi:hypothetical protein